MTWLASAAFGNRVQIAPVVAWPAGRTGAAADIAAASSCLALAG